MKNSEKNLSVLENFILHITHSSEGDHDANVLISVTANELYQMARDYIEEDHVDGEQNPEDDKPEFFIAYRTVNIDEKLMYTEDYYEVKERLEDAREVHKENLKLANLYTAGIAKIIESTDH